MKQTRGKRGLAPILVAVILCVDAVMSTQAFPQDAENDAISVTLVSDTHIYVGFQDGMHVLRPVFSVTDRKGNPVGSLREEDFSVVVDGKEWKDAKIEVGKTYQGEDGIDIGLLVDCRTRVGDISKSQEAARRVVQDMKPKDRMLIYAVEPFTPKVVAPLTSNKERLTEAINKLRLDTSGKGGKRTVLEDTIVQIAQELSGEESQFRRAVVVIARREGLSVHRDDWLVKTLKEKRCPLFFHPVVPKEEQNPPLGQLAAFTMGEKVDAPKDIYRTMETGVSPHYALTIRIGKGLPMDGLRHTLRVCVVSGNEKGSSPDLGFVPDAGNAVWIPVSVFLVFLVAVALGFVSLLLQQTRSVPGPSLPRTPHQTSAPGSSVRKGNGR